MRIVIDIDGTICTTTYPYYDLAEPYPNRIERLNKLYDEGHEIVYLTARGSVSGIDYRPLTETQLKAWGVKYHELYLTKPAGDMYIDDKGIKDTDFFKDVKSLSQK